MTEKQAIWKSILHWRRMIKWVEKQDPKEGPADDEIFIGLREEPNVTYCSLCSLYYWDSHCESCPLGEKFGKCIINDSKNAYSKVESAVTWAGWLYHARRLLKQLESLQVRK